MALDLLDLIRKASAQGAQSTTSSLFTPASWLSAGLAAAMAPGTSDPEITDQTEQGKVADPTVELTPSQIAGTLLSVAPALLSGNPLSLSFLSKAYGMSDLPNQERGRLGQWFDSLFGYATDAEIASFTGSAGTALPGSIQEDIAMQELSDEALAAKLESKFNSEEVVSGELGEFGDLGFQNPDQVAWDSLDADFTGPHTDSPSSEDAGSNDWSFDWGSVFGDWSSDDSTTSEDTSEGPGSGED